MDMSLGNLIKTNNKSFLRTSRSRGSGFGPGAVLPPRDANRRGNRSNPFAVGKRVQAPESAWQHETASGGGRGYAIETGTKLHISNLHYNVSNEDIQQLFSDVGDLKRFSIHYDRSGRSKGTAEVVFARRGDAMAAVKRYNYRLLDGKRMKIEIPGTNVATAVTALALANTTHGRNANGISRRGLSRGGVLRLSRDGGIVGRAEERRSGREDWKKGHDKPIFAGELDADLDKYHLEVMQMD